MSRIGKMIIEVPNGVTVDFDEKTKFMKVKGPLGQMERQFNSYVTFNIENNIITTQVEDETHREQKAMWGTSRSLLSNMIEGVSKGYTNQIILSGVGFKMALSGQKLTLHIGFSHPVEVVVPDIIKLELKKNTLDGTSIDNQALNSFFTKVHNMKKCDVYKHKGFKFPGRYYPKKVGKKAASA